MSWIREIELELAGGTGWVQTAATAASSLLSGAGVAIMSSLTDIGAAGCTLSTIGAAMGGYSISTSMNGSPTMGVAGGAVAALMSGTGCILHVIAYTVASSNQMHAQTVVVGLITEETINEQGWSLVDNMGLLLSIGSSVFSAAACWLSYRQRARVATWTLDSSSSSSSRLGSHGILDIIPAYSVPSTLSTSPAPTHYSAPIPPRPSLASPHPAPPSLPGELPLWMTQEDKEGNMDDGNTEGNMDGGITDGIMDGGIMDGGIMDDGITEQPVKLRRSAPGQRDPEL